MNGSRNESEFWRWFNRVCAVLGVLGLVPYCILLLQNWKGLSALSVEQRVTVFLILGTLGVVGAAALLTGVRRRLSLDPRDHAGRDRGRTATRLMLAGSALLMLAAAGLGFIGLAAH